ncbi:MAG TPA: efflux RND transporter permease subunit [Candidatus Binataceae bacterium]|nr:efflux RND transporter permease subunit [Candidatus Binataceae bacterium]
MWIVSLALRRPLSVLVMAVLMLVLGALSFSLMNVDIFPSIDLPVVMVIWNYPGLPAIDMERRVVLISERALSTTVNGIEHIESRSIQGVGLMKIYFHPEASVAGGIAQINSVTESILKIMPPGMQAPNIIDFNAANVPVAQLNVSSDTLSEQALFDYGLNFIRVKLFTIEGLSSPAPFGGRSRAVMVNLNPTALYANSLSPADISNALNNTNVILPAGSAKIGNREYYIELNGSPDRVEEFNHLPVKVVGRTPVFLGDVAPVKDAHTVQVNVVRVNGKRGTYLAIIKHAAASTMAVVDAVKRTVPSILSTAPKGLNLTLAFDQSQFVRAALWEVVREALIAAVLVAVMVLVFVGSARSMLIVIASIPLSILTAIIGLKLTGQTVNIMTLGGLALAIGMLVDDATVEIENIHRNHAMGKPVLVAILDGAQQIALPAFVGTLAICIVFFPVVLLGGVAKYLFTPLAYSVVFAMLTSYLLSRTLVPMMARYLLPEFHEELQAGQGSRWKRFIARFDAGFEKARERYREWLGKFIGRRVLGLTCVGLIVASAVGLLPVVGQDFFPSVDAGMMRMHVRGPTGTRIEHTELIVDDIERAIRSVIPAEELGDISDTIGLPQYYNLAFYQTDSIGPQDSDVLVQLKPGHRPTAYYQAKISAVLKERFPDVETYFQAADIVSQVLNFGLPAAIDAQISGNNLGADYDLAMRLRSEMSHVPGLTDLRIAQRLDYPTLRVNVDRAKALELGIDQNEVASSLLISLSSSFQLQPNFWLDKVNGVNYNVVTQTPQHIVDSVGAINATPLTHAVPEGGNPTSAQFLANIASISQTVEPAVLDHYTVQRVIDVNAAVRGRDLGSASNAVARAIKHLGKLPPGVDIIIRGQSRAMRDSFASLGEGLILAIILVYLLMVSSYQSWLEPFIIMLAVPGALAGVLWMLVLTRSSINVESLMGAIMAVGVGVANGNLVITFANELRESGYTPAAAAIESARIRLRPVLMTALAMILGMLPMAMALGEGAEQNAPLGRAVIGGLIAATGMTLFVVPAVYSMFSRSLKGKHERDREVESIMLPGA